MSKERKISLAENFYRLYGGKAYKRMLLRSVVSSSRVEGHFGGRLNMLYELDEMAISLRKKVKEAKKNQVGTITVSVKYIEKMVKFIDKLIDSDELLAKTELAKTISITEEEMLRAK